MKRLRFYFFILVTVALGIFSLKTYSTPTRNVTGLSISLLCLTLALAGALAAGRSLLLRFNLYFHSLTQEALFSLALGSASVSAIFWILGQFASLTPWLPWLLLAFALIAWLEHLEYFAFEFMRSLKSKKPFVGQGSELLQLLAAFWACLVLVAVALAPVSFYDSVVYHYALPEQAASLGYSGGRAGLLFSWFPGGVEGLWTAAFMLDGPRLAALLNISFMVALALAVMDAGARFLPQTRLWLAPALLLTQPILGFSFAAFLPDGYAAFFAFLSFYAFLNGGEESAAAVRGRWTLLAALLAGCAVACKPTAGLHAATLIILLAARATRDAGERRPSLLLACFLLFLAPLAPWLLRNGLVLGNPVYPFGMSFFGYEAFKTLSPAYMEHMQSFGSGLPWWSLPWNFFFGSSKLGGGGNFSFLVLAILPALFFVKHSRATRSLMAYALVLGTLWCLGPHSLRYALPLAAVFSLLAALALIEVETWARSRGWARFLRLSVAFSLMAGAAQTTFIAANDFDPFRVVLGLEKEADYLARRGLAYASAAFWLHENAPRTNLLILGSSRSAYLPVQRRPPLLTSVFEPHPFKAWLNQASTPQELDEVVAHKGYDGVLVDVAEWRRVESGPLPHYDYFSSPSQKALFETWVDSHAEGAAFKAPGVLFFFVKAGRKAAAEPRIP